MQSTSPIRRRIVLLRHRGDGETPRWSMERIAPTPRGTAGTAAAAPHPKRAGA